MVIDTLIWSSGMPVEQRPHVEDRVDRDAGHADVARDARVVAVVAAMGGEVEGDRQALLAGGEVAAVEGVADSSAVEKPAYCRIVQGWVAYMVG